MQPLPIFPVVEAHENPGFRADKKQSGAGRVCTDHTADFSLRIVTVDARPAFATIGGLVEQGSVVVELVARGGEVHGLRIVRGGFDAINQRPLRQIRRRDRLPVCSAIAGDMDESIVTSGPEHSGLVR